jgi:amino acid adenylation domain-containing protein
VEQRPEAVAVVFEDRQLTYRELNERANQLAHHLQQLGVGPEALVGVYMERSLEMVVGLLGILKAGGAYLPLDLAYPRERVAFMLEDARAQVLLTQKTLMKELPDHTAKLLCLEESWKNIARESTENPASSTTPDHLAYVMYTSGSTGMPKGVSVSHRGVVRLVKNTNYVHLGSEEVFLQFAPLAFDASTFEIWGPLLNGGRLVVFPPHLGSLEELGQVIQSHKVTTLWLTAALFHQMVDGYPEDLRHVRQLLAGGDVLLPQHVRRVLGESERTTLINGYGPTECTTFTTCYRMTGPGQVGASVSIGRPIANTTVYILDSHLHPVPIGVPGELHIGGDGLARGYLNRPELTAEKFIPNPFSHEAGSRLYKTGDLVRYLPDGNIEFLGRIDQQVKLRGFRIELGELETVLGQHPSVREVVVLAREDSPGDKRLVAYLVIEQEPAPTSTELRGFLKEKLPDYMVPSAFVFLDAFPLTPNGKIDRKVLPKPEMGTASEKEHVAPRTDIESRIRAIWQEVLKQEQIGVHDNFFELGGHSLLAILIISQINKKFGVEMTPRALFEAQTVADLAEKLRNPTSALKANEPSTSANNTGEREPRGNEGRMLAMWESLLRIRPISQLRKLF